MIFLRLWILALIAATISLPALAQDKPIFRNFIWGVNREDVRQYETATWYKSEGNSEYYVEKPDEFYRTIRYDFADGKLWRAQYSVDDFSLPNPERVFDRVVDLRVALEEIYGKPKSEELVWLNRRYRSYPKFLGRAFRSGDVKIRVLWEPPGSRVVLEAYHDGMRYQLIHRAEKVTGGPSMDSSRNILNLPLGSESQP